MRKELTAVLVCAMLAIPLAATAKLQTWDMSGLFKSTATRHIDIDLKAGKIVWTGSARVELVQQGVSLDAEEVTVYITNTPKPNAKTAQQYAVERILLKGAGAKVVSKLKGFSLSANDISITMPEDSKAPAIKSALAEGKVVFFQSSPGFSANGKSDRMEVLENGDKAVLTGSVTLDWTNQVVAGPSVGGAPVAPAVYTGNLAGDKATITGLTAKPGEQVNPHIVFESEESLSELNVTPPPSQPAAK